MQNDGGLDDRRSYMSLGAVSEFVRDEVTGDHSAMEGDGVFVE